MKIRDKKLLSQKTPKGRAFKIFWVLPKKNIYFLKVVDDEKLMEYNDFIFFDTLIYLKVIMKNEIEKITQPLIINLKITNIFKISSLRPRF